MKKLLIILLSVPCLCWGTLQTMEKIVYCGVTNHLVNLPLTEELGDKIRFMPASADGTHEMMFSTACYRGYEGLWEVRDDTLFLNELRNVSGDFLAVSNLIEGAEYPVPALWFSGNLRFSKKQFCLTRADCGRYDLFDNEVVVPVKDGKVSGKIIEIDRRKEREDFRALVEQYHDSLDQLEKDQYHFSFFADRDHLDKELTDLVTGHITNQVSFSARVQVFATDGKKSYGSDFRLIPTEEHRM